MEIYYLLILAALAFVVVGVILGYVSASAVGQLRREMRQLLQRLSALENRLPSPSSPSAPAVPSPHQTVAPSPQHTETPPAPTWPHQPRQIPAWMQAEAAVPEAQPAQPAVQSQQPAAGAASGPALIQPPPVAAAQAVSRPALPAAAPRQPLSDNVLFQPIDREWWNRFEIVVGKRWLTWAGALILVASASFFLKYAFDQGWLGASARVLISIAGGLLLLGGGIWCLRKRMPALGQGLCGAGLAVIYTALYSAFAYYNLLGQTSAFGLMILVTAGGVLLALACDAMAIGVLATVGGYLAPVLVASGSGDTREVLFTYLLLLDLGVLAVALFKRWQLLDMLALLGTVTLIAGWVTRVYSADQYAAVALWLAAFFAVFLLLPFVYHLRSAQPVALPRFILSLATAVLTVAGAYFVLREGHLPLLGTFTLAMSACYLALALAFRLRLPADSRSHNGFLALSIALLTYCIPLLLGLNGALLGWAIEAPLLVYLGYVYRSVLTRSSAVLVLLVALGLLFGKHWPMHDAAFRLLLNPQFGAAIAIPLAGWACALLHYAFRRRAAEIDRQLLSWLGIVCGVLALTLLNFEFADWFYFTQGGQPTAQYYAGSSALTLWTLGAAAFLAAGLLLHNTYARVTGLLIYAGLIIYAIALYDEWDVVALRGVGGFDAFTNLRFLSLLTAGLLLFAFAYLHHRSMEQEPRDEGYLPVTLAILGGGGLLWLLHGESQLGFALAAYAGGRNPGAVALAAGMLIWAVGSALYLACGLKWPSRAVRLSGLFPLFVAGGLGWRLWDLFAMFSGPGAPPWLFINLRFAASLLVVGLIFAYAYALRSRKAAAEPGERQLGGWLYGSADVLLLVLLSAEVYCFFRRMHLPHQQQDELALVSLSIVWGVYALALLVAGFALRNRPLRMSALALFGITTVKLLWQDLAYLEPAYRLASSVLLGLLLIAASYLYHRIARRLESPGAATLQPAGPSADNVAATPAGSGGE